MSYFIISKHLLLLPLWCFTSNRQKWPFKCIVSTYIHDDICCNALCRIETNQLNCVRCLLTKSTFLFFSAISIIYPEKTAGPAFSKR